MQLTGKQVQQIQDALLDGYPTKDELRMLVRIKLEQNLEAIVGGDNLRVIIFNLVSWAERPTGLTILSKARATTIPTTRHCSSLPRNGAPRCRVRRLASRSTLRSFQPTSRPRLHRPVSQLQPQESRQHAHRARQSARGGTVGLDG